MTEGVGAEVEQVLAIVKWVVGLMLPVLGALCATVAVLWKRLGEKTLRCEEDKDRLQREWREQLERLGQEHRAEMKAVWTRQTELLVQVNRTIEHALHLPPARGGESDRG